MEAWLVDALHASGFDGELDDVFARSAMITAIAMLIGTVSGGIMGSWSLALPYLLRALLLVIAGFIQAIFSAWGFYAWQPYFLELLGRNATWVAGVVAALIALAMMAGNYLVKWRSHQGGQRTSLLLAAAVIGSVAAIGVGLVSSFWFAVTLYLLSSLAMGVWMPVKQAYMHQLIPSAQRAMVVSFDSLVSSGGTALGQLGLGRLAETRSIVAGYVIGGLITTLSWPVVLRLRRRHDPEDRIIGDAGRESACGAQGIPCVGGIDSQAGVSAAD